MSLPGIGDIILLFQLAATARERIRNAQPAFRQFERDLAHFNDQLKDLQANFTRFLGRLPPGPSSDALRESLSEIRRGLDNLLDLMDMHAAVTGGNMARRSLAGFKFSAKVNGLQQRLQLHMQSFVSLYGAVIAHQNSHLIEQNWRIEAVVRQILEAQREQRELDEVEAAGEQPRHHDSHSPSWIGLDQASVTSSRDEVIRRWQEEAMLSYGGEIASRSFSPIRELGFSYPPDETTAGTWQQTLAPTPASRNSICSGVRTRSSTVRRGSYPWWLRGFVNFKWNLQFLHPPSRNSVEAQLMWILLILFTLCSIFLLTSATIIASVSAFLNMTSLIGNYLRYPTRVKV